MIRIYRWAEMPDAAREKLLRRAEKDIGDAAAAVRPVLEDVKTRGDGAVLEYTEKFDGVKLTKARLRVKKSEFMMARRSVKPRVLAALETAAANVGKFHREQLPAWFRMSKVADGVMAGEKVSPVESAGLYVPRGKGSFPSVMIMLGVPAMVAGVKRVAVCTPPGKNGEVDAATLVAAGLCGIDEIYRVGGAQAVAALAFGTETIPKVHKIIGPGNPYVTAAKRELFGVLDVGTPAGPSEAIILADGAADPLLAAADLLIEAEHGPDSCALLVTHSAALAEKAKRLLPGLLKNLPAWRRGFCESVFSNYGGIILTKSLAQSIEVVNRFAPEHLEILTENPFETMEKVENAGEILLGPHAPITMGNFCAGVNAILPSGGFARTFSGVSVRDFLKYSSVAYLTREGFDRLAATAAALADYEGFPAHAQAVRIRKKGRTK
ncbi:MAG: histidinol dehydrogenase [bacterium]